ncbi:MAG: hypothetical protein ABIG45_02660, partial [Bacillota bacterium]
IVYGQFFWHVLVLSRRMFLYAIENIKSVYPMRFGKAREMEQIPVKYGRNDEIYRDTVDNGRLVCYLYIKTGDNMDNLIEYRRKLEQVPLLTSNLEGGFTNEKNRFSGAGNPAAGCYAVQCRGAGR